MARRLFTSESVAEGHPDKLCDRISDSVLDAILAQDPQARVACETFATNGLVLIGGEITTAAKVDIAGITRQAIRAIGYDKPQLGFCHDTCGVMISVHEQSPDIAGAVGKGTGGDRYDALGAGDQGIMYGYACTETEELMPLPIMLAQRLMIRLAQARRAHKLDYLGPDGKCQVTIEYEDRKPIRAHTVVLSTQHAAHVSQEQLAIDIKREVVLPVLGQWADERVQVYINPSGRFVIGGPQGDTGMTGRKIEVDTYGGYGSHGGGAFSGKDPTKVDRSASYYARYVAKNVVAAGLAEECEVQVAYAIGRPQPIALNVDTFSTGKLPNGEILKLIQSHFDFRPAAIIERLDLRRSMYTPLSCYGHFGRADLSLPWERVDVAETLRKEALTLAR